MENQRWGHCVFCYMGLRGVQTAWSSQVRMLSCKVSFLTQPLQASGAQKLSHEWRQRVHEGRTDQSWSTMLGTVYHTLELYHTHKSTPAMENSYDNDTGSALCLVIAVRHLFVPGFRVDVVVGVAGGCVLKPGSHS